MLSADENEIDYSKDLSIGVSFIPVFLSQKYHCGYSITKEYDYDDTYTWTGSGWERPGKGDLKNESKTFTNLAPEFVNLGAGLNFVLSYSYFVRTRTAIGFTFSLGYLATPYIPVVTPFARLNNFISSRLLFLTKFGKPEKRFRFILEPGVIGNFEIPIYFSYKSVESEYLNDSMDTLTETESFYPTYMFGVGPYFDLGFEFRKSNYSFVFTGFCWAAFGMVFDENYLNAGGTKYNITVVPIGVELRWHYYKRIE